MRKLSCVSSLLIFCLGCPAEAPKTEKKAETRAAAPEPDWKNAFTYAVKLDPARQAVVVGFSVAPGFHAYAAGESVGRPLELSFDDKSELVPDGAITYPSGVEKNLPVGRSVIVEGKGEIVAKVKATGGGAVDAHRAAGTLRYQVCTESACDRPRTVPFMIGTGTRTGTGTGG